jgi:hypothetical protein
MNHAIFVIKSSEAEALVVMSLDLLSRLFRMCQPPAGESAGENLDGDVYLKLSSSEMDFA